MNKKSTSVEKLAKFEKIAEKRVDNALQKIRLIGNMANKKTYKYTPEHVSKIVDRLRDEINLIQKKFSPENKNNQQFKFDQN